MLRLPYRRRSGIVIMFGSLKDWRRLATRNDCCPTVFFSAVGLAATVTFWLWSTSPDLTGGQHERTERFAELFEIIGLRQHRKASVRDPFRGACEAGG